MPSQPTVLIDGRWTSRESTLDVRNPADGSLVGRVDWTDAEQAAADATAAADAAAAAFAGWAGTGVRERCRLLSAGADIIEERADVLADLLAREAGKRLPEARGEIAFSVEYFRWFAEQARRPHGAVVQEEKAVRRHLVRRKPAGVVASLTPWNFPCSIQARKLAPALAAGCTVVARVSEKAPLAITEMIRCLTDAGLPPGAVNLVHGPAAEVTESLLSHRAVRIVSFTGSTEVGRLIMRQASNRIVRPLLELGGNAPFLVLDDADVEAAVEGAMLARFRNTGQSCIAANRFLVQDGVHDEFVAEFAAKIEAMTVGNGVADPCPDLGPVIDDERAAAVRGLVDEAVAAGAQVHGGEQRLPDSGSYVAPCVLTGVPQDVGLATQEVFGPVAGVFRFSTVEEALTTANATEMGLAGYVYSGDLGKGWHIGEQLDVGILGVNEPLPSVAFAPMGGVKQSGLGREGADIGLEEFTEVQYAALTL
ncbi:NAD-dependent succinate-semialdehyde dehydrogenase [Saccharopolyspora mangrovi]|uniref:NAD-dependent succinate-semialdehyde dehydrogenase n=1 Tax=Saccharopolyspora mangrovi TaxID=3082379 RepID=A0ABU6A4X4_9PSEU|nr:NAD-dependent succinate-semialdehyde dehydrogenase [Saccharopolyspora sp. S2-29]MEB3366596.1 NAD-dependent succinate-semialdehyde dehydrogenase [Saccharopolyspora sp. S2-29]